MIVGGFFVVVDAQFFTVEPPRISGQPFLFSAPHLTGRLVR